MNRKLCILLCVQAFLVLGTSCKHEKKAVVKTNPITFTREGVLEIYTGGTDSLLARLDIEIADSDYETQTGLMYRDKMDPGQGMLFIFPGQSMHSFYMKNTKIPLDLLFIKSDLRIATLVENAKPLDETGLPSRVPVQYVLEVNAGQVRKWNITEGDSISFKKD